MRGNFGSDVFSPRILVIETGTRISLRSAVGIVIILAPVINISARNVIFKLEGFLFASGSGTLSSFIDVQLLDKISMAYD